MDEKFNKYSGGYGQSVTGRQVMKRCLSEHFKMDEEQMLEFATTGRIDKWTDEAIELIKNESCE